MKDDERDEKHCCVHEGEGGKVEKSRELADILQQVT